MRARRILALLLSVSTILASEPAIMTAYAAEQPAVIEEADTASDEAAEAADIAARDTAETADDAGKAFEVETEEAVEVSGEEDMPEVKPASEGNEKVAGAAVSENGSEIIEDEVSDEPQNAGSDCFTVDADGVLKLTGTLRSSVVIPKEAVKIPNGIFDYDTTVKKVSFETGSLLTTIESGAFAGSSVESVLDLPASVKTIPARAFENSAIKTVDFKGVEIVEDSAFAVCSDLSYVNLPSLVSVGNYAFQNCAALSSMSFVKSITFIGAGAFLASGVRTVELAGCESLILGQRAFEGCNSLTTVSLPDDLSEVPARAFYNCTKLSSLSIGTEIASGDEKGSMTREIGESAFANCLGLTQLVFFNVVVFRAGAFDGCNNVLTIYVYTSEADNTSEDFRIAETAFPSNTKITMYGYNGGVKDYAVKRGYKFKTLYPEYAITYRTSPADTATVEVKGKAYPGDTVQVKVTPKKKDDSSSSDYAVKDVVITAVKKTPVKLVESGSGYQIFSFEMPSSQATVNVTLAKKSELVATPLTTGFTPVNDYQPSFDKAANQYIFNTAGREGQLVVYDKNNASTNNWLWNYSSANTKVAAVGGTGVVRAVAAGNTTITATLKADSSKKVTVNVMVQKDAIIERIELEELTSKDVDHGSLTYEEDSDGELIPVVTFDYTYIKATAVSLKVNMNAYEEGNDSQPLVVKSKWTSSNKKVATVAKEESVDNTNTIKIVKGSKGESMIKVSVLNAGEKEPREGNLKKLIIRVIDATPRLVKTTLTVNSRSVKGTKVEPVPQYGYGIMDDELTLCSKKTLSNGTVTWPKCADLTVYYDGVEYWIRNANDGRYFKKTFENSTQLYLTGKLMDPSGEDIDTTFHAPITKLTVTNTSPDPKFTTSGKINLFYNERADMLQSGIVVMKQDLKTPIEACYLVSADSHKISNFNPETSPVYDDDALKNNFDIEYDEDVNSIFITRSENEMAQKDKKDVLSGYLYIRYEGFSSYIKREIKIPTCNTAPSYYLSRTSATASQAATGQIYDLMLLDKKTKTVVELDSLDDTPEGQYYAGLGFTADSTFIGYEDLDTSTAQSDDIIRLQVKGTPRSGKTIIYVKMDEWSKPLKYTFTLKVVNTAPKVKFNTGTVLLNPLFGTNDAVLYATTDQADAQVVDFTGTYFTGKDSMSAAAASLIGAMDFSGEPGQIGFTLPSDIPEGTYSFKTTPVVELLGGITVPVTQEIAFKVNVKSIQPTIKLKNSTFAMNARYPGIENRYTTYTVANTPTGIVFTDAQPGSDYAVVGPATAPDFDDIAEMDYDEGAVYVKLTDDATFFAGKKYTYTVYGLEADGAVIKPFKVILDLKNTQPKVKFTVSGNLNPVDNASKLYYTATVSNIISGISDVALDEVNDSGAWQGESIHFNAEIDESDSRRIFITTKDDHPVKSGKKYKLRIKTTLASAPNLDNVYVDVTVTPKQEIPAVKTEPAKATIFIGGDEAARTVPIKVTQKAKIPMDSVIVGADFLKGTSKTIKDAFQVGYDNTDDIDYVFVKLANPSLVAPGTTYKITVVTIYEGQAEDSTGNKIPIEITVKN